MLLHYYDIFDICTCNITNYKSNFSCVESMANIKKPKLQVLDMSGSNYLSWCLDVKLHLQGKGLVENLVENEKFCKQDEVNALIFICCHLPDCLKSQYLQVRQPSNLCKRLRERYDHTKLLCSPRHKMIGNISSCKIQVGVRL